MKALFAHSSLPKCPQCLTIKSAVRPTIHSMLFGFSLLMMKWKTFSGEKTGDAAAIDNVKQRRGKLCVCGGNFRCVAPKHLPLTYIIPNNISPASSPSSTRTLFPPSQRSRTEAARAELPFSTHATSALCVFYDDYAPSEMHFWRKRKMKLRGKREKIFRSLKK